MSSWKIIQKLKKYNAMYFDNNYKTFDWSEQNEKIKQQGVALENIAIRIQSGAIHHEEAWAEHLPECLRFLAENWD